MDDEQAEAIATEWGVDPELLKEAEWKLETIDGNDGELYGYFVRFREDTDPDLLAQLGVSPGEYYRQVGINVFDEPEPEQDNPFPDNRLEIANAYPEEWGNILADFARGDPIESATGAAFSGSAFDGDAFAAADASVLTADSGEVLTDDDGNRLVVGTDDTTRDFQRDLLLRLDRLEVALQTYRDHVPPRNHNGPPELVEADPIPPKDLELVVKVVVDLRTEAQQEQPDPVKLEVQASTFRRVAGAILSWIGRKADKAVDSAITSSVPIGVAWVIADPKSLHDALVSVADAASALAAHLQNLL
ncbi:hypothetical protein [Ensifer sp. LC14]|uniref:hypothetical protein n=2 Tax=Ensifer TaxID=106591 RepID=UPI00137472B7|nr:hypothetical protein [Ensifer sp. LC14]